MRPRRPPYGEGGTRIVGESTSKDGEVEVVALWLFPVERVHGLVELQGVILRRTGGGPDPLAMLDAIAGAFEVESPWRGRAIYRATPLGSSPSPSPSSSPNRVDNPAAPGDDSAPGGLNMDRRTFLKYSASGVAGAILTPLARGAATPDGSEEDGRWSVSTQRRVFDPVGSTYVFEPARNRVCRLRGAGSPPFEFSPPGRPMNHPIAVKVDGSGQVHVVDQGNHRVLVFDAKGWLQRILGGAGAHEPELLYPRDVAANRDGWVFVCDTLRGRIRIYDPAGAPIRRHGELGFDGPRLGAPRSIDFDQDGRLHVADAASHFIRVYTPDGTPILTLPA